MKRVVADDKLPLGLSALAKERERNTVFLAQVSELCGTLGSQPGSPELTHNKPPPRFLSSVCRLPVFVCVNIWFVSSFLFFLFLSLP